MTNAVIGNVIYREGGEAAAEPRPGTRFLAQQDLRSSNFCGGLNGFRVAHLYDRDGPLHGLANTGNGPNSTFAADPQSRNKCAALAECGAGNF